MTFLTVPLVNVLHRPARSGLTAVGVAVAVGAFLAMVGMARGVDHAWTRNLLSRNVHVLGTRAGAVELLATSIDQDSVRAIAAMPSVRDAAGELIELVPLRSGQTALLTGWPMDSFCFESLQITAGDRIGPGRQDVCMLGSGIAEALDLSPGQTVDLYGRTFHVVGVFSQRGALAGQTIIVPLEAMQELTGRAGRVTVVNICLNRPDDPDAVADTLRRMEQTFDDLEFTETSAVAESDRVMQLLHGLAWGFSALAIVIGVFVLLNTLLMSVAERTREIGILLAVGWSQRRVVGMVVLEGVLLTLLGSVGGVALGMAGLWWLAGHSPMAGFVEPAASATLIGQVIVVSALLALAGSAAPAWRAARLNTSKALRHE